VLFETPGVAARADALHDAADVTERCEVFAGDFFERVPAHGDCYVLANVLHDWDDTRAIEILRNCRKAMSGAGRVLIIERLIPQNDRDPLPTLLSDINMLVITGGQERTNAEYSLLLEAAALTPAAIHQVAFPYGVIEAVASNKPREGDESHGHTR
jgi:O-methyltransferase domain